MALTVAEVRNAKPGPKDYKLADEKGLYLFVTTKGAKSWRMKYRIGAKEKRLTFGLFPDVSLGEARDRREAARTLLRAGRDPAEEAERQAEADEAARVALEAAAKHTFEKVALRWHESEKARWSPAYALLILRALKRDAFKVLGPRPIAAITGPEILAELRKVEARGAIETAKRVKDYIKAVFDFAEGEHLVEVNPTAKIGKALKPAVKGSKQPAITDIKGLRKLQMVVDNSTSSPTTKLASRLLGLTAVRIGVLRAATWDEFEGIDWDDPDKPAPSATWRISAERMKLEVEDKGDSAFDHDVPLPWQAVEVLRALRPLTGRIPLLFPSNKSVRVPMSDSSISTLYKRKGYRGLHVPHGWRAAFSTIMNERAVELERDGDRIAIDLMLAHAPRGISASEYAYNRAKHAKRRREVAEAWADLLCEGQIPAADLVKGEER